MASLWSGFLSVDVWSYPIKKYVYDIIIEFIRRSVLDLQIKYTSITDSKTSTTSYVPTNPYDMHLLIRTINFAQTLLPELDVKLFLPWLPLITSEVVMRIYQYPRISKLYSLLKTALELSEKEPDQIKFLENFEVLNSFFKHLAVKQNEFEDELLSITLELLLAVPIDFIYSEKENSLGIYVELIIKALSLGVVDTELAYNGIFLYKT